MKYYIVPLLMKKPPMQIILRTFSCLADTNIETLIQKINQIYKNYNIFQMTRFNHTMTF